MLLLFFVGRPQSLSSIYDGNFGMGSEITIIYIFTRFLLCSSPPIPTVPELQRPKSDVIDVANLQPKQKAMDRKTQVFPCHSDPPPVESKFLANNFHFCSDYLSVIYFTCFVPYLAGWLPIIHTVN